MLYLNYAVSESLPHRGLLGIQLTCVDPVLASIRARDVTTWSWVNLVHPVFVKGPSIPFGNLLAQTVSGRRSVCWSEGSDRCKLAMSGCSQGHEPPENDLCRLHARDGSCGLELIEIPQSVSLSLGEM